MSRRVINHSSCVTNKQQLNNVNNNNDDDEKFVGMEGRHNFSFSLVNLL